MNDINLNPTLTARFRAVQQHWGYESIGETIALVLDAVIHKWDITAPNTPNIVVDKASKARLKARHVAYFSQMSLMSGLSVTEIARCALIGWICSTDTTFSPSQSVHMLPSSAHISQQKSTKRAKSTHKSPQKATHSPPTAQISDANTSDASTGDVEQLPESQEQRETPQLPTKTTGRSALSGLLGRN